MLPPPAVSWFSEPAPILTFHFWRVFGEDNQRILILILQLFQQQCGGAAHLAGILGPDQWRDKESSILKLVSPTQPTSKSFSTEPSGSFAKAALVGAKTVKGGSRLVPLGKAVVMAASKVEKRSSVASTSPVVGKPAAGENGLEPEARPADGGEDAPPEPVGGEDAASPSPRAPPCASPPSPCAPPAHCATPCASPAPLCALPPPPRASPPPPPCASPSPQDNNSNTRCNIVSSCKTYNWCLQTPAPKPSIYCFRCSMLSILSSHEKQAPIILTTIIWYGCEHFIFC